MAAEMWKVRFRERVLETAGRLERACALLAAVLPHLELPMLMADAGAARARIQFALGTLREASRDLAFVVSGMGAARFLALHGGSTAPATPLHLTDQLGDRDLVERNAGSKLHDARIGVQEAYAIVDWCRGHLFAVSFLLDQRDLPDIDDLIDEELLDAVAELENAIANAQWSAQVVAAARQDVSGVN